MQVISLRPIPNQTLQTQLGTQAATLDVMQFAAGLFISVYVGDQLIIPSVLCLNLVRIVRDAYLGFSGDLVFVDTQGSADPVYTGLGGRFSLVYLSPDDLTNLGVSG